MDVGLGSERKYGLDREDSPSKRSDKIDDVLDKLDDHLKDGISRDQLEKCQRVLDKLADQYKDSCSKSQLSRMYKYRLIYIRFPVKISLLEERKRLLLA